MDGRLKEGANHMNWKFELINCHFFLKSRGKHITNSSRDFFFPKSKYSILTLTYNLVSGVFSFLPINNYSDLQEGNYTKILKLIYLSIFSINFVYKIIGHYTER